MSSKVAYTCATRVWVPLLQSTFTTSTCFGITLPPSPGGVPHLPFQRWLDAAPCHASRRQVSCAQEEDCNASKRELDTPRVGQLRVRLERPFTAVAAGRVEGRRARAER